MVVCSCACVGGGGVALASTVIYFLILFLAVPRRLYCLGSLVFLDVVFRYSPLFLLYSNIKIGKNRC